MALSTDLYIGSIFWGAYQKDRQQLIYECWPLRFDSVRRATCSNPHDADRIWSEVAGAEDDIDAATWPPEILGRGRLQISGASRRTSPAQDLPNPKVALTTMGPRA